MIDLADGVIMLTKESNGWWTLRKKDYGVSCCSFVQLLAHLAECADALEGV